MKKTREIPKPSYADQEKFIREKNIKENRLAIEHFRARAQLSENPLIRTINAGNQIDTSIIYPSLEKKKQKPIPNLVEDRAGELMLSQGPLPHLVHNNYRPSALPTPAVWHEAERRQTELQRELIEIEKSIAMEQQTMQHKFASSALLKKMPQLSDRSFVAPVIGSTFKFHTTNDGRSTYGKDFKWHEKDSSRVVLQNTQYGYCTRICDVPGGNLNINPNAVKKHKPASP